MKFWYKKENVHSIINIRIGTGESCMRKSSKKIKIILFFQSICMCIFTIGCSKEESIEGVNIGEIINKKNQIKEFIWDRMETSEEVFCEEQGISEEEEISEEQKELYYGEGELIDRIYNYLGYDIDNMGFLYYNLSTGEQISFNEDKVFYAASLYKLNMNMIVYNMITESEISSEDMVYLEYYPDEQDNEYINYNAYLEPTNIITLLDNTIISSDNTAAAIIYHYIGGWSAYRYRYFQLFNIENQILDNETTVNNEFEVLKKLYDNKEEQWYSHLIDDMKNTDFHDRIDKYIPQDIVAHKVGNLDEVVNDEGIVFTDEPYILIFLTDGVGYAESVIADISKAIYIYNKQ